MPAHDLNEQPAGKEPRGGGLSRRSELIGIAYRHIAERGFEGLRVREVAGEAGINNATLHYYFPTKEALIQGVVDRLMQDFVTIRVPRPANTEMNALAALRVEFEDARQRLRENPEQFVVFTELFMRSLRDETVARVFARLDEDWHGYLMAMLEQGVQEGVFRVDLNPDLAATVIMAQIKGMGYQMLGVTGREQIDSVVTEVATQVEGWLTGSSGHEARAAS